MGENNKREKKERKKIRFWSLLKECVVPFSVFIFFIGTLSAGLYFSIPDIFPLTALVTFPLLLVATSLSGLLCFVFTASFFLLALVLSNLESWRMLLLFLTFALPSIVLMLYKSYPRRVGTMVMLFCEESTKLDSTLGVCALAVRLLKSKGFFKHIALLFWNKETDKFKIVAATSAYDVGTEIPSDMTFYVKCHSSLKIARFHDPYSSLYFLPSKFKARSSLCAPLHLGGRRFGVIVVESHFSRSWSRSSQQVLQFFAVVLSYVIAEFETRDGIKRAAVAAKKGAFPAGKTT